MKFQNICPSETPFPNEIVLFFNIPSITNKDGKFAKVKKIKNN